uniref:Cytochrome P450 n=1 Tax=Coptis japonica var. dissecta TaxID=397412 RepID=A9ZT57_COPJA|nr:cytochrome P450 [Coptis japonica var. dissecta]
MEILLYFLLFISSILVIKFLVPKRYKNLPPGPPSLPLIGHLHLFKKPLHRTLAKLSDKYGHVLYLQFGSRPVLVVSSPSAAEDCLAKNDIIFANRPHLLMGKILGHDYTTLLWAPYGPNWRNLRKISAIELLSANRLQSYSDIRHDEVKSMVQRLSGQGNEYRTVEMKTMIFELTLNVMMTMIAGKRYYGGQVEELEQAKRFQEIVQGTLAISGASNIGDFLPILSWIGIKGIEKKVWNLKEKRDKFLQELIEEHRISRSGGMQTKEKNATLIDVLLSLQETEPEYYTDEMILGIIWVLLAAGTDTSAVTMEWAMSLLLNNPQVIKKAQAEIDNNLEQGRLINESDVNKLPYLHSIITETLRIYPAGPLLVPHESSEECIVGGYKVPSGTMLLVNVWAIQQDPNIWVEPTKFKPERFDGFEGTRDGFKLMPFGSGRRGCPGEGLAMRVVALALGALIQCFDWERVGEEMVDMSEGPGLTLPKVHPLEAKCRPRSTALNFISQF